MLQQNYVKKQNKEYIMNEYIKEYIMNKNTKKEEKKKYIYIYVRNRIVNICTELIKYFRN